MSDSTEHISAADLTAGLPKSGRIHDLKTWPSHWRSVRDGTKTFEVRKNDRDFALGDVLRLRLWDPCSGSYVNERNFPCGEDQSPFVMAQIVFILSGGRDGIPESHCVLGIRLIKAPR